MAKLETKYYVLEIICTCFYYVKDSDTSEFYYDITLTDSATPIINLPEKYRPNGGQRGFDCEIHDQSMAETLLFALSEHKQQFTDDCPNGFYLTVAPSPYDEDKWQLELEFCARYFGSLDSDLDIKVTISIPKEQLASFAEALREEEEREKQTAELRYR